MSVPSWEAVPEVHRAGIEARCGQVLKAEPVVGGLMPGMTARLHTGGGVYFFKAIPGEHPAAPLYRRERAVNGVLGDAPAPRLLWSADSGGWVSLLFEYVDGRDADLSPGSPDLPSVLDALKRLNVRHAWQDAPPVAENIGALQERAAALLAQRLDEPHWAMYAEAVAGFSPEAVAGPYLLHYDPHPGNFRITRARANVVDWASPVPESHGSTRRSWCPA